MKRAIDTNWLETLARDKTYKGIDVMREYGKMKNWCMANRKIPTERRFINWLNRVDVPVYKSEPKTSYTSFKREVREPSDQEFRLAGELARAELERFKQEMRKP